jgi:hypothetical protein
MPNFFRNLILFFRLINCTGDVKFKVIKLQCGFNQVMPQNQTIIEIKTQKMNPLYLFTKK